EIGDKLVDDFGSLESAFEEIKNDPQASEGLDKKWINALMPTLQKMYKEKETEIKVGLFLASYEGNGLNKVKNILTGIRESTGADIKFMPNYKDGYNYRLQIRTKDPKNVEKKLKTAAEEAIESVKSNGEGSYKLLK
ncbi:hypothetical protein EPN87_02705, partial [archaeon]